VANQYHLELLQQGSAKWNLWRSQSPGVQPDLRRAVLSGANLDGANLSEANLKGALLRRASLQGTIFWRASLRGADLRRADLRQANFYQADLLQADLRESDLSLSNFREACLGGTNFANVDLSTVKGLETIRHTGRSYVDIHTLCLSQGRIPENFLRGVGAPDHFITYAQSLSNTPIQYLSCFISSSGHDYDFASRLYTDLQNQGVRSWFVSHELQDEDNDFRRFVETFQTSDTWLLVLSEYTIASEWIKQAVRMTMSLEERQRRTILFPLCSDSVFLDSTANQFIASLRNRQIRDFTHWNDEAAYQQVFTALLHDLQNQRLTIST
jgi:TIR domain/Pentapeptide repeats (8 copies)